MSHFAEVNEENVVLRVLVCDNDYPNEGYDWLIENLGGRWIKTSYNANIRKKFAAIGDIYDEALDAFILPQPFSSWVLNKDTCEWEAPEPYPVDGKIYTWNEETTTWIESID